MPDQLVTPVGEDSLMTPGGSFLNVRFGSLEGMAAIAVRKLGRIECRQLRVQGSDSGCKSNILGTNRLPTQNSQAAQPGAATRSRQRRHRTVVQVRCGRPGHHRAGAPGRLRSATSSPPCLRGHHGERSWIGAVRPRPPHFALIWTPSWHDRQTSARWPGRPRPSAQCRKPHSVLPHRGCCSLTVRSIPQWV